MKLCVKAIKKVPFGVKTLQYIKTKIRFAAPVLEQFLGPDGGTGRRAGLKHQCLHWHAGSSPARGTD